MKIRNLLVLVFLIGTSALAQVGIGTVTPSEAAMLEVSSQTENAGPYKGFMPPRVPDVAARDAINATPLDEGLLVFVQSSRCLEVWTGIAWEKIYCNESAAMATDLFISEYVEGSQKNKVIEIANFTGNPVDLDNYRLFISYNGGGSTSIIYFNLGSTLNHGSVYIIKHPEADPSIIADQTLYSLNFNGNDPVVLQSSSGAHIDILGVIGNTNDYGKNVTLRKKPATGPSTVYQPQHYDVLGLDDFSGLGAHTY